MEEVNGRQNLTLVVRKKGFGLPTACPACLPAYIYLKFARVPFDVAYHHTYPDSDSGLFEWNEEGALISFSLVATLDQIPYIESGTYVAFNNEKGGVIESLKEDGIINLDSEVHSRPEWISMKAMVDSSLADAILYELWLGSDVSPANKIYFSHLPWLIGKPLYSMQVRAAKQLLGITKDNVERKEGEIYKRAAIAYGALSTWLGEESFLFENRPTSLDAVFLAQALFTLHALPCLELLMLYMHPIAIGQLLDQQASRCIEVLCVHLQETSVLRGKLLDHDNLVRYATMHKRDFVDSGLPSSVPSYQSDPSSSTPRQGTSSWGSKPKSKPKREKTEQEKTLRRRAKYFLVTQLVAVLVFLTLFGGSDDDGVEVDGDDDSSFDD